ncbi:MAG: pirin family protein [Cellvibrionales bacterium]
MTAGKGPRKVVSIRQTQDVRDGAGVAIQRLALVGDPLTDPLLLLDELNCPYRTDFAGGFPDHPHRGMQTLTYLKSGGIAHADSLGNRGEIRAGGVQWLSAGSGVIHSEMPTLDSDGLHGFQLWFNLPAAAKGCPPRYRDIAESALVTEVTPAYRATVIAGDWPLPSGSTVRGPLHELEPQAGLIDLELRADATVELSIRVRDCGVAYIYDGAVTLADGQVLASGMLAITGAGDHWRFSGGPQGAKLLVIAGRPIGEPVVGYGPFVMNTREEIEIAVREYQMGTFIK